MYQYVIIKHSTSMSLSNILLSLSSILSSVIIEHSIICHYQTFYQYVIIKHSIVSLSNILPSVIIKMNDATLKHVVCPKHLGTILTSKPKDDVVAFEDRFSVLHRTTYGLLSIGGKKNPHNPTSAVKVYKQQALPRMLCGTEVSQLCNKSIKILGNGHWLIAKHIEGLKPQTSNITVLRLWTCLMKIGQLLSLSLVKVMFPILSVIITIYKRLQFQKEHCLNL